jgi:ribosomal protein L23
MFKHVSTEKATNLAKSGRYTFWVEKGSNKGRIKSEIAAFFKVTVISVRTLVSGGKKKAIVTLKEGQKIDIFEEKKKK